MTEQIEHRFLTLSLCGEHYAIPIGCVREVLEYTKVTRLPRTASYLKGIIGLRGKSVPVLDLRLRFGMPEIESTGDTAIIVVEISRDGKTMVVGILADAVHEVVEIEADKIEAPPRFGAGSAADFLRGIGRGDSGFILILDLDLVLDESGESFLAEAETAVVEA